MKFVPCSAAKKRNVSRRAHLIHRHVHRSDRVRVRLPVVLRGRRNAKENRSIGHAGLVGEFFVKIEQFGIDISKKMCYNNYKRSSKTLWLLFLISY